MPDFSITSAGHGGTARGTYRSAAWRNRNDTRRSLLRPGNLLPPRPHLPPSRRPLSPSWHRGCGCFNGAGGGAGSPADVVGISWPRRALPPPGPPACSTTPAAAAGGSAVPVPAAPGAAPAAGSPQPRSSLPACPSPLPPSPPPLCCRGKPQNRSPPCPDPRRSWDAPSGLPRALSLGRDFRSRLFRFF